MGSGSCIVFISRQNAGVLVWAQGAVSNAAAPVRSFLTIGFELAIVCS